MSAPILFPRILLDDPPPRSRRILPVDEYRLLYSPFDVVTRAAPWLSLDEQVALCQVLDAARQWGEADACSTFSGSACYRQRNPRHPSGVLYTYGDAMVADADAALLKCAADEKARAVLAQLGFRFSGAGLRYDNPHGGAIRREGGK